MSSLKTFKGYLISEAAGNKQWLGIKDIPKTTPALKAFIKTLGSFLKGDVEYLYFDDIYDYKKASKRLTIKITDKSLPASIAKNSKFKIYGFQKSGENYVSSNPDVNVVLYPSGGVRGSGKLPRKGEVQKTPSTAQQELGSIAYFEGMLGNKVPTLQEISKEVEFDFGIEWLHNFEQQWKAFKKGMGKLPTKSNIYLDSGTNESNIIIKVAKRVGLKDQKDNWNPADIWLMSISKSKIASETKDITSLEEYNAYLLDKFNARQIVGISLKKVSAGKAGKFKIVSSSDIPLAELKPKRILFDPYQKNFIFETQGTLDGFNLRVGYKAGTITALSDIRIYLEGRMKGTAVQLGGVSSALFPELAKKFGGFDIAADKKRILADPVTYINKNLKRIVSKGPVDDKTSEMPTSELKQQAAAFLLYYLDILISSDPAILTSCFYSSSKMNDFSSIHCKLY
mgnify:FL=1